MTYFIKTDLHLVFSSETRSFNKPTCETIRFVEKLFLMNFKNWEMFLLMSSPGTELCHIDIRGKD